MEREPIKAAGRLAKFPAGKAVMALIWCSANEDPGVNKFLVGVDGTKRTIRMPEQIMYSLIKFPPVTVRRAFLMLQRYGALETVRRKHGKYNIVFDIRAFDPFVYMHYAAENKLTAMSGDKAVKRVLSGNYADFSYKPEKTQQIMPRPGKAKATTPPTSGGTAAPQK